MSSIDYLTLLTEAHAFTMRNLHRRTASCDTGLPLKKYDDATMQVVFGLVQDMLHQVHPGFIANKCHFICLGANALLLQNGFHPILTTGYILLDHLEKEYYTGREELLKQFEGIQVSMELNYHVWLTVGDYIIDPTYITTHRIPDPQAYPIQPSYDNKMIFFKHASCFFEFDGGTLEYIPQLTGDLFQFPRMPFHP